jgi:low temperature requirement protein LtrA
MGGRGARTSLLREREGENGSRVTFIELFFDLVFVFAVTQLSHSLLGSMTAMGATQTALLFVAVWWAWVNTSWCTNWLDPERTPVRLMLMALMLAGLCMSTSIPGAFGEKGLPFAGGMAAMQVGRSAFMLWAFRRIDPQNHLNFQRITAWLVLASSLWVAGAFGDGTLRLALWAGAALVESSGPAFGYHTPGLGRSMTEDWRVDGHHMAERCGLFIIIALGESILLTGATFAGLAVTWDAAAAFVAAFLGSVTMWWIYFDVSADTATERIVEDKDPGRLARLAYTYFHMPLVAGIIVCAVADELVLKHPSGPVSPATAAIMIAGPALYVGGNALFKRAIGGEWPRSHLLGLVLLAACVPLASLVSPLGLTAATTFALVIVAAVETVRLRRGKAEAA